MNIIHGAIDSLGNIKTSKQILTESVDVKLFLHWQKETNVLPLRVITLHLFN